ncbi:MAG: hypothetical protein IT374_14915 [Polyangiaceae bacterium]|nr:hypothetical protein [Polyangiaceae bacterium]
MNASKLFHVLVVGSAALGAHTLGCGGDDPDPAPTGGAAGTNAAGTSAAGAAGTAGTGTASAGTAGTGTAGTGTASAGAAGASSAGAAGASSAGAAGAASAGAAGAAGSGATSPACVAECANHARDEQGHCSGFPCCWESQPCCTPCCGE